MSNVTETSAARIGALGLVFLMQPESYPVFARWLADGGIENLPGYNDSDQPHMFFASLGDLLLKANGRALAVYADKLLEMGDAR